MTESAPKPTKPKAKRRAARKPNPLLDTALGGLPKKALAAALSEAPAHAGTADEPEGAAVAEAIASATAKKPHGNTAGFDAIPIRALIRDTEAVRMRLDGHSYPSIAATLAYGHRGNAQRAVQRRLKAMREDCAEDATELRQIECARLDVALAGIMGKVRRGDVQAVAAMLRIQERRSAYEGLDQPRGLKVEVTRELEGFLNKMREEFDDDVFERVLAVIAGEHGSTPAGPAPSDQGGEDRSSEGGGGEESPAADPGL